MSSSDSDESELTSIFGGDTASKIPAELRPILLERWSKLRQELDSSRPSVSAEEPSTATSDPIARSQELDEEVEALKAQLGAKSEENENLARQLEDMHSSYSTTRQKSVNLEESNDKLSSEIGQLRRDRENLSREVEELREVSERRRNEIENLHSDCKRLTEQLAEANASKCEALIRSEDIEAKEIALKHRESRLEQERDLFEQRLNALAEDLRHAHDTASITRREMSTKIAQLEGELSHRNETIRILEGREEALNGDKDVLQGRLDELIERLKEARDSKSNIEEGFRQQVRAQTRLAELYQKQAEDADEKAQKLTAAVTELQSLLKEASERYGALEDHFEKEKAEHKDELNRRNHAIRVLRKELTDANELIKNLKQKGLTEEGIEALSPAAAAASKLIKSGMTLTQVYSQLVTCQEELLEAEDEKRRLNTYLEQILCDIEQRAPALKKQRDEYERAVTTVNQLTKQIETLQEANRDDTEAVSTLRRKLEVTQRDNDRLVKQAHDLGQQVAILLREVEAARFGRTAQRLDQSGDDQDQPMDADGVISDRLVTFKNVQELQQRNVELLAVVREVTAKQEASEAKLVEERTADLKKELETVQEQLEQLKDARRRQEVMVENIIAQRDMYKSMADAKDKASKSPTSSTSKQSSGVSVEEVRAAKLEAALEEVKKDFDVYREEKCTHEKMLNEALEKTRVELAETRAKAVKLASNEEWNTERFKIAQANNAAYKKEISFMEEKIATLHNVVAKHEQSIQGMHNELMESNSQLSRVTNQLERARHEISILKNAEARLEKEREILQRQRSGSAMISENLKMVQLQLEKVDSEARMRLTNQNEDLNKEVSLLKKKLDQERDSYHKSVVAWESSQVELRAKLDALKESEVGYKAQIEELTSASDDLKHQLKISQEKLALVQAGSSSTGGIVDSEKVVDLQSQVNALKNEVVALKEHLSKARQATNQYKELADAAEKQVMDSNEIAQQLRTKYEELTNFSEEKEKAFEAQIKELEEAKLELVKKSETSLQAAANDSVSVQQLEATIKELREQLVSANERQSQIEAELSAQLSQVREIQLRYERELMSHAQTTSSLTELRGTVKNNETLILELEHAKKVAEENLKHIKDDFKSTENTLVSENASLREQFETIEKENAALHEQLSNVTTQMSSLHDSFGQAGPDQSLNMSKSFSEEEAKSMDQLMEIIKHLRKEKAILTGKVEVAQSETIRLRAQMESIQSQLAETQNALRVAQEKASQEMLPSAKYSQLLERVQTIPALSDSNRVLREERDTLKANLAEVSAKLQLTTETLEPLESKLKAMEETEEKVNAELAALKADNQRWRQRVSQLIEKHQKISPEEMMKVQTENSSLKKRISDLTIEQKNLSANFAKITNRAKALEKTLKEKEEELQKIVVENQNTKSTNQQIGARFNALTKKVTEMEGVSAERDNLKAELDAAKNEAETLKKALEEKEKALTDKSDVLTKLKNLGRTLKTQTVDQKKELEALKAELASTQEKLAAKEASPAPGPSRSSASPREEEMDEAECLLQASANQIAELENKVQDLEKELDELKADNEKLRDTSSKAIGKEERAKSVLEKAKSMINKEKEDKLKLERELQILRATKGEIEAPEAIKALETMLAAEKQQCDKLKESFEQEREKLQKQIDSLKESQESNQPLPKSTTQVQPQRSKAQPQAQVQPTRHAVQVPQTATIRPTAMRTSVTMRPSSTTSNTLAVASVSPSSAVLNVNAPEFVPTTTSRPSDPPAPAVVESAPEESAPPPLAMVPPRQSDDIATATSTVTATLPGPSTSTVVSTSTTASVAPTPKRPRDDTADEEDQSKKARVAASSTAAVNEPVATTSSALPKPVPTQAPAEGVEEEDDVVVLSSSDENEDEGDENEEEAGYDDEEAVDEDVTTEGEAEYDEMEERIEDAEEEDVEFAAEESSQQEEDMQSGGRDDAVVVEESDEEAPIEYVVVAPSGEDQFMDDDQSGQGGGGEETGGAIVPQMAESVSSSAEARISTDTVMEPEPSGSSSEARSAKPAGQFDDADDGVVPSTPKLSTVSEAISTTSQVPTFLFGGLQSTVSESTSVTASSTFSSLAAAAASSTTSSTSSGVKGASQEGIDRTEVDISQFAASSSSNTAPTATGFAALAQLAQTRSPTFTMMNTASTSASPFASTVAPVFGGPPSIGKTTTTSAASNIFATKSSATPSEEQSQPAVEASSSCSSSFEQAQEGMKRQVPKLSRTPIVWNSPPGGSMSASSQGTSSAPSSLPVPLAIPTIGGRGAPGPRGGIRGRGQRARRSKPQLGSRGGLPQ